MKQLYLTLLLVMAGLLAGVQTAKAQRVVLHMKGGKTFECSLSQMDSITFKEDDIIIKEEHEWVDLDLPSGTLWATCNIGANSPEECGDYFAWGETERKYYFTWNTYLYCNGSQDTMTKYCYNSVFGDNGFTDNLSELLPEDDAATANWGNGWQMPNKEQFQELIDENNTTTIWTTLNDTQGRLITSKSNGKSIFMPAARCFIERTRYSHLNDGEYWSRSLGTNLSNCGHCLFFRSDRVDTEDGSRSCGLTIRPVRVKMR